MTNDNSFVLTLTGLATMNSEPDTNNDNIIFNVVQPSSSKQKDGDVRIHHSLSTFTGGHAKNTNFTGIIILNLIFYHIFIIHNNQLNIFVNG